MILWLLACAGVRDAGGLPLSLVPASNNQCTRILVGVERSPSATRGETLECHGGARFDLAPTGSFTLPMEGAAGVASRVVLPVGGVLARSLVLAAPGDYARPWSVVLPLPAAGRSGADGTVDLRAGWAVVFELTSETLDHGTQRFVIGAEDDAAAAYAEDAAYCGKELVRIALAPAGAGLVWERDDWDDALALPPPACSATHEGVLAFWLPAGARRPLDGKIEVRGHPPRAFRLRPAAGDNYTEVEVILEHP